MAARERPTGAHTGTAMAAHVTLTCAEAESSGTLGLADGGTTDHILRYDTYLQLQRDGLVGELQPLEENMSIMFGKHGNEEPVIGKLQGVGALGRVCVVKDMGANMLISEREYAEQEAYIDKDKRTIGVVQHGRLVLYGTRDPSAAHGATESLWQVNLRSVFTKPGTQAPRVGDEHTDTALSSIMDAVRAAATTALANTTTTTTADSKAQLALALAFRAKPAWTGAQVRAARLLIWAANNMSGNTLGRTLEAGALRNQPDVDPRLLRDIAARRDNPVHVMTHDTHHEGGGSGIREEVPGRLAHTPTASTPPRCGRSSQRQRTTACAWSRRTLTTPTRPRTSGQTRPTRARRRWGASSSRSRAGTRCPSSSCT